MSKYVKKPIEVEAIQWNGWNTNEILEFGEGNISVTCPDYFGYNEKPDLD